MFTPPTAWVVLDPLHDACQQVGLEESALEGKYPGQYAEYKAKGVKRLIPFLY